MTRSLASDVLADCHFSTKPAGKFLWLSGLLIRRLMALYCLRLSSNGISAGSVICMIASFCSGLKHFTRLTLSSSVLMVPQFQKKISRQLEKGSMTSILTDITKDHYAIDRNCAWCSFGSWTRRGFSGPDSSSQQQLYICFWNMIHSMTQSFKAAFVFACVLEVKLGPTHNCFFAFARLPCKGRKS